MGKRYNAAHIPEADVKEAWSNYAKYDYYYTDELQKAQETLESTTASARAQLAAKGIFEGDPKYTREIDRITNIAQADMASLQAGQTSLQTGAIKDLLLGGQITKYSAGNYGAYRISIVDARETLGMSRIQEGDAPWEMSSGEVGLPSFTTIGREEEDGLAENTPWTLETPVEGRTTDASELGSFYAQKDEEGNIINRMDAGVYEKYSGRANISMQSMGDYYTGVYGGYDPHFDVRADQERTSEETARGKAGSRAYTVQAQPKGQPGGGKPGNVFMQTPEEVAQDQAPQDEQGKAWWM